MKYLIWDFDGTIAYRDGMWSGTVALIANRHCPDAGITIDQVRPWMKNGFPWHYPEIVHLDTQAPEKWWQALAPMMEKAFSALLDINHAEAAELAGKVRQVYIDLEYWHLYDDALEVLKEVSDNGYKNILLSNHVPELTQLIEGLGLDSLFMRVYNSAQTGIEKPNPKAFLNVIEDAAGQMPEFVIGDNLRADISGANALGLKSIWIDRNGQCVKNNTEPDRKVSSLTELLRYLE